MRPSSRRRVSAVWRMPKLIRDSACTSWLRCTRTSRSTWAFPSRPQRLAMSTSRPSSTPSRVLAGERLHEPGQIRPEQVDHRPGEQLGDAAAAAGVGDLAVAQGPLIEGLDVLDGLVGQQRPVQAVDEAGVDVLDVRIYPADDVAVARVQALPHALALAPARAGLPQDIVLGVDGRPLGPGDGGGVVAGAAVHDDDLFEQAGLFAAG